MECLIRLFQLLAFTLRSMDKEFQEGDKHEHIYTESFFPTTGWVRNGRGTGLKAEGLELIVVGGGTT